MGMSITGGQPTARGPHVASEEFLCGVPERKKNEYV